MATLRVAVKPEAAPMKAAQISKPGADFELIERKIPEPGAGQVRIKVQACGVCHSDVLTKEGLWPGIQYPRVPGHEVVGIIDEVSAGVSEWTMGQRVGVGWHGGHDGTCLECRRGDFGNCRNMKIAGISYDGGYQQYMLAPVEALVAIPERLNDVDAAPLLCAGITTFNALRHSGAFPGDLVAVQVIGATFDPIEVTPVQLISGSRTIQGWASGIPTDSEDTLRFAELTGVRAMIETYPLEKADEAYARMISGDAQFRVVLTM